jgi:hypothetical protein
MVSNSRKENLMETKSRVKWKANSGKVRHGTYIFDFAYEDRAGRSLVVGETGQQHVIAKQKLQLVTSANDRMGR